MRFSLKRVLQWVFVLALLQLGVYYWAVKRPRRIQAKVQPHKFLDSIATDDGTCSFKKCPEVKEGMINVHFVPHSHIDVGWLKTVDQYYTGESPRNYMSPACVRCTLNTTIAELLKDPSRRFIFIEMVYLYRYWNEADEAERKIIQQLVKERRLEIVNGGWVMSDAGVAEYNDIIDQHTLGFDFIKDHFGVCGQSRTGWHVDQFGHSREHASLLAQMGYDSVFIGRTDFLDLADRKMKKNLEFVWKASPQNLKDRSTIFVQSTYDGYYAPPEYVFDNDIFLRNDANLLERMTFNLVKILHERARCFKTNHLLVPMGSDFGYRNASKWFSNMDALMQKINAMQQDNSKATPLNVFYSTPSCYTYYVNKAKEVFETKTHDLHPYGVSPGVYWTGYFTTRGGFKMHIRRAGHILQACKQLSIFTDLDNTFHEIYSLRDAMAVMQHHDAITGTQTLLVLRDYNRMLSESEEHCVAVLSRAYHKLWYADGTEDIRLLKPQFCYDLNISSCQATENSQQFMTTIYNPLSWSTDVPVRLPIKLGRVTVTDWKGQSVRSQVVPVPEAIRNIPERSSITDTEVLFSANLPPMSVTSFLIKTEGDGVKPEFLESSTTDIVIENQHLSLTFHALTGKLVSIYNKDSQIKEPVSQEFAYYIGQQGGPRPSGAYVFVPAESKPMLIAPNKVEIKVLKGELVQEVHQKFSSYASQIVRLYDGARHAEFQWVVGPLDDSVGKEVISKFTTDLKSGDKFYTDSNGREIIQRIREKPGSSKVKDLVSGNYFAVTNRIYIQDEEKQVQLTVITDRPQGGSSLVAGAIELMVHRRLLFDDGLGVGEALKDQGVDNKGIIFTGKHYLCLDTIKNSAVYPKHLALQTVFSPLLMFTPVNDSHFDSYFKQHTFLSAPLPDNVHILTLDRISEFDSSLYLLRLEHVFEVNEHPVLSQPVKLSLQNLFQPFEIVAAEETTLGGNFKPHDVTRMEWETVDGHIRPDIVSPDYKPVMKPPFEIELQPMEIRTFRITVARED